MAPASDRFYISRWIRRLALIVQVASLLWVMLWLGRSADTWTQGYSFRERQWDYYSLLVDGFLKGQASLPLTPQIYPHSRPDGTVPDRVSAPLDTSPFEGRVYIYYGVAPAVLLLLPYSLLTGGDLSLNAATVLFVALGFLASLAWYRRARCRLFPAMPYAVDAACILILAFMPATTFLVRRSMFYELPLAAGYTFLVAALYACTEALYSSRGSVRRVGTASLMLGLAAGCHPNYALLTPLVAFTAFSVFRKSPGLCSLRDLAGAAVIPAAVAGLLLAIYNLIRFGNPLEFGFNYGQNAFFYSNDVLRSLAWVAPNIRWYFFSAPSFLPYFPFFFPTNTSLTPAGYHGTEAVHGQMPSTLLIVWVVLGLFAAKGWKGGERPPGFWHQVILFFSSCVVSLCVILVLGIRANRYLVDFQAPLAFLVSLLVLRTAPALQPGLLRAIWSLGLLVAAGAIAISNTFASIQQFDTFRHTRPAEFAALSKSLNPSWRTWEQLGWVKTGRVTMDVTFKPQSGAVYEPLLTTGVPHYSDTVFAAQHPNGYLELFLDHLGHGGPRSGLIPYETGRAYRVDIDLGSFYPPATDTYYSEALPGSVRALKRRVRVWLDGTPVIDAQADLYDSAPWMREVGENPLSWTVFSRSFSGAIANVRWVSRLPELDVGRPVRGAAFVRLKMHFPEYPTHAGQPLLALGQAGAGSLVLLRPREGSRWQVCVDQWGHGFIEGPELVIEPGSHQVDLLIGPNVEEDPSLTTEEKLRLAPSRQQIVLILDSAEIVVVPVTQNLEQYTDAQLGINHAGFSTAQPAFYGEMERATLVREDLVGLVKKVTEPGRPAP